MKTYIEIVQTGDGYSVFVLRPNEITPESKVDFTSQEIAERASALLYPGSVLLSKDDFAAEVQRRIESSLK